MGFAFLKCFAQNSFSDRFDLAGIGAPGFADARDEHRISLTKRAGRHDLLLSDQVWIFLSTCRSIPPECSRYWRGATHENQSDSGNAGENDGRSEEHTSELQ